jgi:hypothetical protein
MSNDEGNTLKAWAGITLFFAVSVAITLVVAIPLIERGKSAFGSIAGGAFLGCLGSWLSFMVVGNTLPWIRRSR